jgi:predicted RNA binding protein YcfA (HicA-like mRNA interferase family)
MPRPLERRDVERWLLANGFTRAPGGKTSHVQFVGHGIRVTLQGHGPKELTKKHVGMLVRQLRSAGLSPDFGAQT